MFSLNKIPADSFVEVEKELTSVAAVFEVFKSMVVSVGTSCSVIKMITFQLIHHYFDL